MGIIRVLLFLLTTTVFAIAAMPLMIYRWFFMRCTACGKRGTMRFRKMFVLRTKQSKKVLENTCFYVVCRNCGNVRKDINGTWYDVGEVEWALVNSGTVEMEKCIWQEVGEDEWAMINNGVFGIQIEDKTKGSQPKRLKNSLRKKKRERFEQN